MKSIKKIMLVFYLTVLLFGGYSLINETKANDPCGIYNRPGCTYTTEGACCVTSGFCEDICS